MAEQVTPPAPQADDSVVADAPTAPVVEEPTQPEPILEDKQADEALKEFAGDAQGLVESNDPQEEETDENPDKPAEEAKEGEEAPAENTPPASTEEKPAEAVVQEEPAIPTTEPELEDPGEFQPNDYSFEITTKDGKTHKVTSLEDADALADVLDENPENISAKQLIKLATDRAEMAMGIKADQRAYETKVEAFKGSQEQIEIRNKTIANLNNGMVYLEKKGLLPSLDTKLTTTEAGAKWRTDYKDEPGVAERLALIDYIDKENVARREAGLDPSFDVVSAYNSMKLEELQTNATDEKKEEGEARKAKGAMVGGSAPYVPEVPANDEEIVGTGGNLNELYSGF